MTRDSWLTAFDEAMADSPKGNGEKKTYEGVPDGDYVVTMKAPEISLKDGKDNAIILKYYFPKENREEWDFLNLNERAAKVVAAKCKSLGLTPRSGDEEELLRTFQQTNGWTIKLRKVTTENKKGDNVYKNKSYYINGIVSKGANHVPVDRPNDLDIPF